jgi:tetratricopeptide (TPR) repeat protein
MIQTINGDFSIILLFLLIVRLSATFLNTLLPGISWALSTILLVALVPGALYRISEVILNIKWYRIGEEVLRIAIILRQMECILPLKYLGWILIADQYRLFILLKDQQRYTEALKVLDQVMQFAEKRFGSESMALSECLVNRCGLLDLMGDLSQAEEVAQRAMNILDQQSRKMDKASVGNLCLILNNAGVVFANAGKSEKANEVLKRATDLKESTFDKESPQVQAAYANQGYAYLQAGNYSAAEEYLKRAIKLGKDKGQDTIVDASNWNNLGDALRGKGELEQADLALKEALRIRQLTLPNSHPHMGYSYNNFGKLYRDQGKFEEAKQYFEKALQIREAISPKHPDVANTLKDYAALLRKMDRIAEAEKLEARANSITAKKADAVPPARQKVTRDLGTTILVRTTVVMALLIILPISSLCFVNFSQPEKVPEGLGAEQYYALGVVYKGAAWVELSRDALNRAIKLDPKESTGVKAGVFLKTSIPRYPISKDATELNIEGFNQKASGEDAKAIATCEECIKKYPTFEWPYSNLGTIYVEKGDTVKAEELFNKALSINPCYVNAWIGLAKAKRKANDSTGAQQCIEKALSCADGNTMMVGVVKRMAAK